MSPSAVPPTTSAVATPHANGKSNTNHVTSPASNNTTQIPAWVQPDLTRLLRVEHNPGSFTSRSVSLVNLPPGAVFARITNPTPATVAYSSVQAGRDLHIELNCDLLYINHSCKPSLVFDMERWEVRVSEQGEGLKEGDELTFFYPSTEWSMAQPFDCLCKTSECRGQITGAKDMPVETLRKYWLNKHIEEMLAEKNGQS
ncbi:galactose-proton symport [Curvularia clavata]|uniref:Galactose-proton symport n=1 Tax=Curvularia clavata TaxID=95742 RepID=A0A9Q9DTB7_CURCL|nr:galactose-proton symport [Curvularia clavata]